ncbi:hypothetical protein [Lacipirellula limnantheis]|uniref:Uncharacterized protein n=1 Tax=Lacipirellula limnantheis TaxID=2528024 RepID=A0A517TZA5_9BACT|nr:hypothetical protein [Lacipirellula limnantheis]QDT73694.1 hypothetical protein I41_28840 [Lacipirellula limnantheis]
MERAAGGSTNDEAGRGRRWLAERLTPAQLKALASQGFVAFHRLPSGARCAKLRYRDAARRQRVLYVGTNEELAAGVVAALAECQSSLRRRRQVRALAQRGASAMRTSVRRLEQPLQQIGWRFHGRQPRRRRRPARSAVRPAPSSSLLPAEENNPLSEQSINAAAPASAAEPARASHDDALRRWALALPQPIDASIGWHAATLLEISSLMAEPIKAEILQAENRLETIADLATHTEVMLKTIRQGERLLKMLPRTSRDQEAAAKLAAIH